MSDEVAEEAIEEPASGAGEQPRGARPRKGRAGVPPAVAEVEALLALHGAMRLDDLSRGLRERGRHLPSAILQELPDRYELFVITADGRLALSSQLVDVSSAGRDAEPVAECWWTDPATLTPVELDRVVVLDLGLF